MTPLRFSRLPVHNVASQPPVLAAVDPVIAEQARIHDGDGALDFRHERRWHSLQKEREGTAVEVTAPLCQSFNKDKQVYASIHKCYSEMWYL